MLSSNFKMPFIVSFMYQFGITLTQSETLDMEIGPLWCIHGQEEVVTE